MALKSLTNKMDNPHLQVDVFSIAYSKILYHNYSPHVNTGIIVLERGNKSMPVFCSNWWL